MLNKQFYKSALVILLGLSTTLPLAAERRDSTGNVQIALSRHERELGSSKIKELLHDQLSPFRTTLRNNHNAYVTSFINKYTNRNYHSHLSKMKGLASYYFPIFDKVFREMDIPSEIKYLSIVESSLNPHAVSRVGATGPWQFMYATAKGYGLQMNSYVDERKDPIEATYAAANYLKEAYGVYNDWLLAIASYNCGPGNVNRAIRRSGKTNPSFWEIREYLPNETRNYVPAFIAMCHVFDNPDRYPIEANYAGFPEEIDVIVIEKKLTLASVAKVLDLQTDDLYKLNPSYKRKIINGSKANPSRLIVPKVPKQEYAKLYNFLQGKPATPNALLAKAPKANEAPQATPAVEKTEQFYIAYKVKKGDTLEGISKQFKGSSVSSLRAMNGLRGSLIKPGMTLKIRQD